MSAFDSYVQARFHGGAMKGGGPTFTVIHDAETPLRPGYADSIAEFFRVGPKAGTSAHAMVGPDKAIKLLPDDVVAYAAGPYANPYGYHFEQAGYARFSPEEWVTPDGLAQVNRLGSCVREVHDTWGIPKRWMTDDQLRRAAKGDRASGGMATHQQVARVLGGTTHIDPEKNYCGDLLLQVVLGTTTTQEDDMQLTERIPVRGGTATVSVAEALARASDVYDAVFFGGGSTPYGASLLNLVDDLPRRITAETGAQVAAAQAALAQLEQGGTVDLAAVQAAAKAGAEQALAAGVDVDVTVGGSRPTSG